MMRTPTIKIAVETHEQERSRNIVRSDRFLNESELKPVKNGKTTKNLRYASRIDKKQSLQEIAKDFDFPKSKSIWRNVTNIMDQGTIQSAFWFLSHYVVPVNYYSMKSVIELSDLDILVSLFEHHCS